MSAWVACAVLVPLATGLAGVASGKWPRVQRLVTFLGLTAFVVTALVLLERVAQAGPQRLAFGSWPAPFGIEFVVDGLSAVLLVIAALTGAAAVTFQTSSADPAPQAPTVLPLMMIMLAGVAGAFVTADLFNLYVWFEVMLLASLGLLAVGGRPEQLDATLKYFVLNALGTLVLLIGIAAVYGATGHLNYDALARAAQEPNADRWLPLLALLAAAFLVKAGAFPVFSWLPASYHTLPAPLLALFAGLPTKLGVYALLRLLGDVFGTAPHVFYEALGWLAALTMVLGALGAAYHWDLRRILAFHIVSQIGYLLLGVAFGTATGTAASLFFLVHNVLAKVNLILIAAIVSKLTGSYDLRRIGGLYATRPALSILFLISALAMVGVPPLSGFWAKLLLVREALTTQHAVWAAVALLTGFLTLYSMIKIWFEAFWKDHPVDDWAPTPDRGLLPAYACVLGVAGCIVALGLVPDPLTSFLQGAAEHLGAGRFVPGAGEGAEP
jgi:multicomponent Na+:H+ antiporter subunit D